MSYDTTHPMYDKQRELWEFMHDSLDAGAIKYKKQRYLKKTNGKVLAFSRKVGFRKLYDMNDELDKTTCDTYQEMWEEQVHMFKLSDWIFVDELFDLIIRR